MNKIVIDPELCKGCELCITFCPLHIIKRGTTAHQNAYLIPEQIDASRCTACCLCAMMCPDSAIEVYKDVPTEKEEG